MSQTSPDLSATAIAEKVVAHLPRHAQRGRRIEDVGFVVAIGIAGLYGLSDFLIRISVVKPGAGGFPYMTVVLVMALVLPKTVGRATAGAVWVKLAERFGGGGA